MTFELSVEQCIATLIDLGGLGTVVLVEAVLAKSSYIASCSVAQASNSFIST